jgi:hypothetical protein
MQYFGELSKTRWLDFSIPGSRDNPFICPCKMADDTNGPFDGFGELKYYYDNKIKRAMFCIPTKCQLV